MENLAFTLDHHAATRPDKVVLTHGATTRTNAELLDRVHALAAGLADLGVGVGDVVAILLPNRVEFFETIYATNRLGAAFLPLNLRLSPAEWSYILGHAGARVVVCDAELAPHLDLLALELDTLEHVLVVEGGAGERTQVGEEASYERLVERRAGARVPVVDLPGDALQRLMYTSGTTSRPKGVMISHRNFMYKSLGMLILLGWSERDIALVSGPLYHVGALDMGGLTALHAGGSLVLQTRFEAGETLDLVERHRPTTVWLAPAMVNALLQHERVATSDLGSLETILSGGEKMPEARLAQILDLMPDVWFADAYGLTETVSGDTYMTRDHMRGKLGSVGRPVPHLQLRVVDEDRDVAPGEVGEVVLRGPKVFGGYWRDPEATAAALRGGWFHTGDLGRLDADGFLYIEDRMKDMIVSGGENIASPEVERVLYEHPDVVEAAVVAMAHERWGQVPRAFVVVRDGAGVGADQLREFCLERLARFKVPQRFDILSSLPRTPSGKVLKRELRDATTGSQR
ncbi:acyl-CoA synthetase [Nocardioides pantholopis]|uniref:acyl-CoA synthetase n=1 Tax=Nocardioides pantholopis TaxID=2483798 RepID=UPI000F07A1C2|nr:long-chain fatty acid--CoA ligase [Nocardioides pantholopis]